MINRSSLVRAGAQDVQLKTNQKKNLHQNKIAFSGWKQGVVDGAIKVGQNPAATVMISSLACLIARPIITLIPIPVLDKDVKKEDRYYSAAWQAGICAGGIGAQFALGHHISKGAEKIAQSISGVNLSELAKSTGGNIEQLKELIGNERILKLFSEAPEILDKVLDNTNLNNIDKAKLSEKGKELLDELIDNPHVIEKIKENEKFLSKLKNNLELKNIITNINKFKGTNYFTGLLMTLVATTAATAVVTKYLDNILDWGSKKFTGKPFRSTPKTEKTPDEVKKQKRTNIMMGGAAIATAGYLLTDAIGLINGKGHIVSRPVLNGIKSAYKNLRLENFGNNIRNKVHNGLKTLLKTGTADDAVAQLTKHTDKGIEASIFINLGMRGLLLAVQKEWYALTKAGVDELLALTVLGKIGDPVAKAAKAPIAKFLSTEANKIGKNNDAVKVIADQGIKNIVIIGVVMGFLNNIVTGGIHYAIEKIRGKKPEKSPEPNPKSNNNYNNPALDEAFKKFNINNAQAGV